MFITNCQRAVFISSTVCSLYTGTLVNRLAFYLCRILFIYIFQYVEGTYGFIFKTWHGHCFVKGQ